MPVGSDGQSRLTVDDISKVKIWPAKLGKFSQRQLSGGDILSRVLLNALGHSF
jgi:hypothetical protein